MHGFLRFGSYHVIHSKQIMLVVVTTDSEINIGLRTGGSVCVKDIVARDELAAVLKHVKGTVAVRANVLVDIHAVAGIELVDAQIMIRFYNNQTYCLPGGDLNELARVFQLMVNAS